MFPLPGGAHDSVFSQGVLRLGEIHWYLLSAANLMYARLHARRTKETPPAEGTSFAELEPTEFAGEVGRDEINWWVFKKEEDVTELRARTERSLDAVQVLKQAAVGLKGRRWVSYDILLATLKDLVDGHSAQLDEFYDYVKWLHTRDVLAPSILFAYRVWGSTRRSDRWLEVKGDTPAAESTATMRSLAEIALGLRRSGLRAWDKAWLEVGEDTWSALADTAPGSDIEIPVDEVMRRATWQITDDFATYFEEVRDSLRNILLDIDRCIEQRDLLYSDAFWRRFVEKAAASRKMEPQVWDFKETLTMWRASADRKEPAKVEFAEDVASFANARGGVLIVGVTDREPRQIVGIGHGRDVENRLKSASDVASQYLDYPRDIVLFREVLIPSNNGVDKRCLVVVVAQACQAVGVRSRDERYTYPIRRETGIARVARLDLVHAKIHMKSDNHDFIRELAQFVDEN